MNLEALKKSLADKVGGLDELKTAAFADDATEDQVKALDDELEAIEALEKKISTAERIEDLKKSQAEPARTPVVGTNDVKHAQLETENLTVMNKVGIFTASLARSVQAGDAPNSDGMFKQLSEMGYERLASDEKTKSLISTTGTAGGFAVDDTFNEEIFDELKPYTAFLRGGPDMMPMPTGNYRQSGIDTRGDVSYRGEGTKISVDQPTLREIDLSAKLLGGIVPITNQLIQYSGGRAGTKAQETLSFEMGVALDIAGFAGNGVGSNPLGIYNTPGILRTTAAVGTAPTVAEVETQLRPMINQMESFVNLGIRVGFVMPQRVIGFLQDLRDENANLVFPTMQGMSPTFKGYPVYKNSTQSVSDGAGTNETTIGLVSFGNIMFGDTRGLSIKISNEASYTNAAGDVVSSFENDMTLVRATMEHDWTPMYNEAVSLLDGVQWGAS